MMVHLIKGFGEDEEHNIHISPFSKAVQDPIMVCQEFGKAESSLPEAILVICV